MMIKHKRKTAFSLIELSIVLLIVGLVIAAISKGSALFSYNRLTNARTITNSSPVPTIPDLGFWVEATSEKSFNDYELQTSTLKISTWRDINPNNSSPYNLTQSTDAYKPTYVKNCISSLPCLRFSGDFFNGDGKALDGTAITFFIVEKSAGGGTIISASDSYAFYIYNYSGNYIGVQVNGGSVGGGTAYHTTPRILTVIPSGKGTTIYENGQQRVNSQFTPTMLPTSSFTIASLTDYGWDLYSSDIGEIIIYNRGLANYERQAVESYLSKKWLIKLP